MKLNEFAKEVHQNAVDHGWWEEERTFGEIVALCHSELSEALEEFRAGRPMVRCVGFEFNKNCVDACTGLECLTRFDDGLMPEGIAVELADCIIRILDWLGRKDMNVDELVEEARLYMFCDVPVSARAASLGDHIARWHLLLSLGYSCWCRGSGLDAAALRMALCIYEIMAWAEENGVDMEKILTLKHAYNKGRPYRHGGKVL